MRTNLWSVRETVLYFCLAATVQAQVAGQVLALRQFPSARTMSPTRTDLDNAISLAAKYLERMCSPEGKFVYRIDAVSGKDRPSYNIVRHAGAMYALGMLNDWRVDPLASRTLSQAAQFLQNLYIGAGPRSGQLAVWNRPLPNATKADLGATALGIVGLVEASHAHPGSVPRGELEQLGVFLLFLEKDDGSFINRYDRDTGPDAHWQSLYYPGEAALAFISLYEFDHSRKWLIAADKALSYLARSLSESINVPPDHWALIATAKLLPYCAKDVCSASRDLLIRHAVQVSKELLSEQEIDPDDPEIDGAFDEDGGTAPTATCIEGLLAALEFLPSDYGELRNQIRAATGRGIAFLLRAQIKSGAYAGGLPREHASGTPEAIPIRIDYVQHALCAWIRYRKMLEHP